jgi:hypothetical protein
VIGFSAVVSKSTFICNCPAKISIPSTPTTASAGGAGGAGGGIGDFERPRERRG